MGDRTWREVLGDAELPDGLAEFLDEVESRGWHVRSRWGAYGIRIWPENGRPRQTVIDLRYPMNEARRDVVREIIASHSNATQKEGGTK